MIYCTILVLLLFCLTATKTASEELPKWYSYVRPVRNTANTDSIPKFVAAIMLASNKKVICNGAFISPNLVLTVCRNCLRKKGVWYKSKELVVAWPNQGIVDVERHIAKVVKIKAHDDCSKNPSCDVHNIAMLKISIKGLNLNERKPVAIITKESGLFEPNKNDYYILATYRAKNYPIMFMHEAVWWVETKLVIPRKYCKMAMELNKPIKENTCTGYQHVASSKHCLEDFGATLSHNNYLIGLLVNKWNCGSGHSPALYVNMGVNLEWIEKTMSKLDFGKRSKLRNTGERATMEKARRQMDELSKSGSLD